MKTELDLAHEAGIAEAYGEELETIRERLADRLTARGYSADEADELIDSYVNLESLIAASSDALDVIANSL